MEITMSRTTETMQVTELMLAELELEAQTTRRVLQRVPEGRMSWRPHPKSSTLGQLALHVATIPSLGMHVLGPDVFEAPEFTQPEARTAAELITALDESVASGREFLSELTPERAAATWRLVRGGRELIAMPRLTMIRSLMFNHWYHHRGSLMVYLRLLEVSLPSVYGPTADERTFG
jgi:uncharacterized damage-inducible protein DinB